MLLPEELYDASLKERLNNTQEWLKKKGVPRGGPLKKIFSDDMYDKAELEWPSFCFGAINSWLLIVGPSPGNAEPAENKRAKEYEKLNFKLWLGAPHPIFKFEDKNRYFKRLSEFFIDNFFSALNLNATIGGAVTHHSNLLPRKSGNQPDLNRLSSEERDLAINRFTHVFRETQPRCIVTNTMPVFEFLRQNQNRFCVHEVTKPRKLDYTTPWGSPLPRYYQLWKSKNEYNILFACMPFPGRPGHQCLPEFAADLAKIAREELNADP